MSIPIRVLIVEDSQDDAELMLGNLADHGFVPQSHRVETEADYLAGLNATPDVILSDYHLPHFSGPRALELLNERRLDIPFIALSGDIGDEAAAGLIKLGASDFLHKDRIAARLGQAVAHALKLKDARDERRRLEAALAESEEKFRLICETATDAVLLLDEDNRIRYANPAIREVFGYAPDEVEGKRIAILQPARLRESQQRGVTQFLDTGLKTQTWGPVERMGLHQSGREFPVEITYNHMIMRGKPGFVGVIRDITERKNQEQKIARLSRIHAVKSGISSLIVRVRDRKELSNEACRIAVEHGGFGIAWIGMLDPDTLAVNPVGWAGIDSELLTSSELSARADVPEGQGAVGRAIREKRPEIINDFTTAPYAGGVPRREAIRRGYRSIAVFPLLVDDSAAGTLTLFAKEANFFTTDELKLLNELAGEISFALQAIARQAKLDKLSRIRAVSGEMNAAIVRIRQREPLLKETCRIAAEHGKFEQVWVASIDIEKQEVRPVAWVGFSPGAARSVSWATINAARGTLAEAIQTRRPAINNNIEAGLSGGVLRQEAISKGCLSTVCMPLVVDDTVVALCVLFAPGEGFFDADELVLLAELAADVSFALSFISREEKLNYLAYYDVLTGLPNRTLLADRMMQHLRVASHENGTTALVLIDLERFQAINDSLGRSAADELLKQVAARLQSVIFDRDSLARAHGDVFAALFPGIKDEADIARIVEEKLIGCLSQPFTLAGQELRVSAKAGVALFPGDATEPDALFSSAEAALRQAKDSSDRYLFYARKMNAMVAERLKLENKLLRALEQKQFVLFYQPKVDFRTWRVTGLEALMRWDDPDIGLVSPMMFIPLLEETGMIIEVGAWVMKQAVSQYAAWQAVGLQPPRIAVNISQVQLKRKDFVTSVQQAVAVAGKPDHGLDLEITESMIMDDIESSIEKLKLVRELGVGIAIDDFGMGHSSLRHLTRLPLTALKIDLAFVQDMTTNPDNVAIVSTIITLARTLKLKVIAEGVETEEQSKLLRLLKCDEMQGYLFSEPVPAEQIPALLARSAEKR